MLQKRTLLFKKELFCNITLKKYITFLACLKEIVYLCNDNMQQSVLLQNNEL